MFTPDRVSTAGRWGAGAASSEAKLKVNENCVQGNWEGNGKLGHFAVAKAVGMRVEPSGP